MDLKCDYCNSRKGLDENLVRDAQIIVDVLYEAMGGVQHNRVHVRE